MKKLSIIIPVYNVEKYLKKCIDSLIDQDEQDFEILLIDDGSPDKCGAICDEYANKDSRIKVFHKENGGVSSARNLGLDNASGEYITFVDSDDAVTLNYVSSIFSFVKKNADLTIFGVVRDTGKNHFIYKKQFENQIYEDIPRDMGKLFSEFSFQAGSPVNKVFKRSIIEEHKIRFRTDLKVCEDMLFCLEYVKHIKTMLHTNSTLYTYICNPTSATQKRKLVYVSNKSDAYFEIKKYLIENLKGDMLKTYSQKLMETFSYEIVREINSLKKNKVSKKIIRETISNNDLCKEIISQKPHNYGLKIARRKINHVKHGRWFMYNITTFGLNVGKGFASLKRFIKTKVFKK